MTFSNVSSGIYRLRVVAGKKAAVIRSRVILMPQNPNFCSLNTINEGIRADVMPDGAFTFLIEFRPIGREDVSFYCTIVDKPAEYFQCKSFYLICHLDLFDLLTCIYTGSSPLRLLDVDLTNGSLVLKIVPDPKSCHKQDRKSLKLKLAAP